MWPPFACGSCHVEPRHFHGDINYQETHTISTPLNGACTSDMEGQVADRMVVSVHAARGSVMGCSSCMQHAVS
jgi:hypothetical protein